MVEGPKGKLDSDEAIVFRYVEKPHDEAARRALSDLFSRYRGRVYSWCFRLVGEHEQAMDLAQETLLAGFRDIATFGGRARFSSWLFSIARHRCLDVLRRPSLFVDEPQETGTWADTAPNPDRALEERIDEEAVLDTIKEALDPLEQKAIWLRCFERVAVDDITRMLNISATSGARGVLQNARRKLRGALERRVE